MSVYINHAESGKDDHGNGPICSLVHLTILGLTVWIERKLFLRDTGRKLNHLDQEIHSGHSELSEEIAARFGED